MSSILKFFKTTLLGGVFFLLPLAFAVIVLDKTVRFVAKLILPLVKALPLETEFGAGFPYIISTVILILIGFIAGLIAKTSFGTRFKSWIEASFLNLIPGYTLLKGFEEQQEGLASNSNFSTALLGGEGRWELCIIVERHPNGFFTLFKPNAPTPTKGAVIIASPDQVREIDVPIADAFKCLMQDGGGAAALLKDKLNP